MKMKLFSSLAVLALVLAFAGSSWAALHLRGTGSIMGGGAAEYNLVYDDILDVTWLDFTKGGSSWYAQITWADGLEVDFNGLILDNWRLPATSEDKAYQPGGWGYAGPYDSEGNHAYWTGYNMVNSEMGSLYYESLGFLGHYDISGTEQIGFGVQANGYFNNLSESDYYWSGTGYSPNAGYAWVFDFSDGGQYDFGIKSTDNYALALMDGDVASVPLPGALWLLGSGLAGLIGLKRGFRR